MRVEPSVLGLSSVRAVRYTLRRMGGLKDGRQGSSSVAARLTGSLSCSLLELCVFHGIDTGGKRIMTYNGRLLTADVSMSAKKKLIEQVVFRENMNAPLGVKLKSLYPGFRFAVLYKVCQRTTTYGCQPFLYDYLNRSHAEALQQAFGRSAQPATYSLAGGLMGTLEVIFLPADTLKIIAQTNKSALRDRSTLEIIQNEGFKLYRGGVWTAMRNFPGSVGMFGGSAVVKDFYGLTNYNQATVQQEILASSVAAIMSLTLSSPFDVIKARVQRSSIDAHMTGTQHLRQLLAVEGPCALFKGLSTKMAVVGPKLMLSFTVFNQVMAATDRWLNNEVPALSTVEKRPVNSR